MMGMAMSNEFVRNLMAEQRKRLLGSLFDYLEKQVYPKLTVEEQKALRERVITSVGVFYDFMLDCTKASVNDGVVYNEEAVQMIRHIYTQTNAQTPAVKK